MHQETLREFVARLVRENEERNRQKTTGVSTKKKK